MLAGKSPPDRAAELVNGTKLKDVADRKKLYEGGKAAIDASNDPMILLAKLVDPDARERAQDHRERGRRSRSGRPTPRSPRRSSPSRGRAPTPTPPSRCGCRSAPVKGYEEDGKHDPVRDDVRRPLRARRRSTTTSRRSTCRRAGSSARTSSNLKTPFNFVCTADIIGGNSGSPVINRDAEVVGLIFDGNIQSLVLDFVYTDEEARAVSVHSPGIIEALRKVYDADELADELTGKGR